MDADISSLLSSGLHGSAELMAMFMISSTDEGSSSYLDAVRLFADSLFARNDYRRALHHYRLFIQKRTQQNKRAPSTPQPLVKEREESVVKFRIAQCLFHLREHKAALQAMDTIPAAHRSVEMNMTHGRWLQTMGLDRTALQAYRNVLSVAPHALEAVFALVQLGANAQELLSTSYSNAPVWLQTLIKARAAQYQRDYKRAISLYASLEKTFRNNLHIDQQTALCYVELLQFDKAVQVFEKIRRSDPNSVELMDYYAFVLRKIGDASALNRLSNELIFSQTNSFQTWTSVALYCELRGRHERGLQCIERALYLNDRSSLAHTVKANLLHAQKKVDFAVGAYRKAYSISRPFDAASGLVKCYLEIEKFTEALAVAKEMASLMPSNARATALYARALASFSDTRSKARTMLEEALAENKKDLDVVLAMVSLNELEGKHQLSIPILQHAVADRPLVPLYLRLAAAYVHLKHWEDAMRSYGAALALCPSLPEAIQGLTRLEKLSRGVDPDAPDNENDEENEEENEENINEETRNPQATDALLDRALNEEDEEEQIAAATAPTTNPNNTPTTNNNNNNNFHPQVEDEDEEEEEEEAEEEDFPNVDNNNNNNNIDNDDEVDFEEEMLLAQAIAASEAEHNNNNNNPNANRNSNFTTPNQQQLARNNIPGNIPTQTSNFPQRRPHVEISEVDESNEGDNEDVDESSPLGLESPLRRARVTPSAAPAAPAAPPTTNATEARVGGPSTPVRLGGAVRVRRDAE